VPGKALADYEFAGELSLSGELRPIRGALAMVLAASDAGRSFILPQGSAAEAVLAGTGTVLGAHTLLQVCAHLGERETLVPTTPDAPHCDELLPDLKDVRGQTQAKRALEIAAAGEHSLLMAGPPGTGKSMLAARLSGIMPPLAGEAARASAAVLSLVGQFRPEQFGRRPYRSPHHTASAVALVGGGVSSKIICEYQSRLQN